MNDMTTDEVINELKALMDGHDPDERNFCLHCTQRFPCLTHLICSQAINKIEELQSIVDKLPMTADGVPVVPGVDVCYRLHRHGGVSCGTVGVPELNQNMFVWEITKETYSTREAAEEAMKKGMQQ